MRGNKGYTILEVMAAMFIAAAILSPLSLWFYRIRTNQAAYEKYYCTQLLKRKMHRVFLENGKKSSYEEIKSPKYYKLVVETSKDGAGVLYRGRIEDRRGRVIANLNISNYE